VVFNQTHPPRQTSCLNLRPTFVRQKKRRWWENASWHRLLVRTSTLGANAAGLPASISSPLPHIRAASPCPLIRGETKKILRQGQGSRVEGVRGSAPHVDSPNLELPTGWHSQKYRHADVSNISTHRHIDISNISMCTNRGVMI